MFTYADEEAKRLNHRHIGTEHLLLGLLREKDCLRRPHLAGRGADLETLRKKIEEAAQPFDSLPISRFSQPKETIELHGVQRDAEWVRHAVSRCREYSWHWQKRQWTPRDIVVNRKNGAISFELSLAAEDPSTFELVPAGWKERSVLWFATGSYSSRRTTRNTALATPTAASGCARSVMKNSGSGRTS